MRLRQLTPSDRAPLRRVQPGEVLVVTSAADGPVGVTARAVR